MIFSGANKVPPSVLVTYGNNKHVFPDDYGYGEFDSFRIFTDVVNYAGKENAWKTSGVSFDYKLWRDGCPFIVIDLSRVDDIRSTSNEVLRFKLVYPSAVANIKPHLGILREEKVRISEVSGRIIFKRIS